MFDSTVRISAGAPPYRPEPAGGTVRFTIPQSPLHLEKTPSGGRSRTTFPAPDDYSPASANRLSGPGLYQRPPAFLISQSGSRPAAAGEDAPDAGVGGEDADPTKAEDEAGPAEGNDVREPGSETDPAGEPLDEGGQADLDQLQSRDQEVRRHEQAHKAAGGAYAGAISYEYSQGPDGKRYAVGGEVSIDISEERDPIATIAKMRQVKAAANAPADPSSQDRSVAAEASRLEMRARQELRQQTAGSAKGGGREDWGEAIDSADSASAGASGRRGGTGGALAPVGGAREPLDVMA